MSNVGFATLSVIPSLKGMQQTITREIATGVQGSTGATQSSFAKLGKSAIGAFGGFAVGHKLTGIFNEVDTGMDLLRTQTGATGSALKGLETSFKRVGGSVPDNLTQVGTVMADLATRTGLTGGPLERLTKQMLDLQRTGPGIGATTASITRVFGDWSIATGKQAGAMDQLFRASQATGPPVEQISQLLVQFGAPLRQLGFGFTTSAALLGKFQKEGVNTELVMGSLRIALGKMARSGVKDVPAALAKSVDAIKNAGSAGKANALALELFGARAGPDMAAAIREGRFDLGKLFSQVQDGKDTISTAAGDALDFGDKVKILGNKIKPVLAPLGQFGQAISGLGAGFGAVAPLLSKAKILESFGKIGKGVSKIGPLLGGLGSAFKSFGSLLLANPIFLIAAAVIVIGIVIFKFRRQIGAALGTIGRFFVTAGKAIIGFFKDLPGKVLGFAKRFLPIILAVLFPPAALVVAIVKFWGPISRFFTSLPGRILGVISQGLQTLIAGVIVIGIRIVQGLITGFVAYLKFVITFWRDLPGRILKAMGAIGSFLLGAGRALLTGLLKGVKAIASLVINYFKTLPRRFLSGLGNVGSFLFSAGAKLVKGLRDGAIHFATTALAWFRGLPAQIVRAVGDLGRLLFNVGKAILRGLIAGAKAILGELKDFFVGIGNKIVGWKGPLDADKKMLTPAGQAIMQSLLDGVAAEESRLKALLSRVSGHFESFAPKINAPTFAVRASLTQVPTAQIPSRGRTGAGTGATTVNQTFNVYNPKPEPASVSTAVMLRRAKIRAGRS